MNHENYEKIRLVITEFDTEDVITTSGIIGPNEPGGGDYPGGYIPEQTPPIDYFEGSIQ